MRAAISPRVGAWWKERRKLRAELSYWRRRREAEGELRGQPQHYQRLFTTLFDLTFDDYAGARVLDVGCGPRGSLEWASMAASRVGVDPLADEYRRLQPEPQAMSYVQGYAENLPFPAGSFDIVASLNSLDHVRDVGRALGELARVCAEGGLLLLVVEVNHPATVTEPHALSWDVVGPLEPVFVTERVHRFTKSDPTIYGSILAGELYDESIHGDEPAILCARLRKALSDG
jgi:SAM-dependent methyltransferase